MMTGRVASRATSNDFSELVGRVTMRDEIHCNPSRGYLVLKLDQPHTQVGWPEDIADMNCGR